MQQQRLLLRRAGRDEDGEPFTEAADIYACGVTLYRLVNGDEVIQRTALTDVTALAKGGLFPDRTAHRDFVPRSLRIIIHRALNPDPRKRFKSAQDMRRALEGCDIVLDWDVQKLPNGSRWSSGTHQRCIEVQLLRQQDGSWEVLTRHGPSKHRLRRINRLCAEGLKKPKAEQWARRDLQAYVALGRA